jgi:hypothetical protein
MKVFRAIMVVALVCCLPAQADVWMWTDADGNTHFVDTNKPIFTWVDEGGDIHYSDSPDHEDAVSVELIWVSNENLNQAKGGDQASQSAYAYPGETPAERAEREAAEAYYCKRATEIYESYVNAPRLYKTGDSGNREYLDEEEAAQTIAETLAQKEKLCG